MVLKARSGRVSSARFCQATQASMTIAARNAHMPDVQIDARG